MTQAIAARGVDAGFASQQPGATARL